VKSKEAIERARRFVVRGQWTGGKCGDCGIVAPDHLIACNTVDLLRETGAKGDCPRCFTRETDPHAPGCLKAAKA
jgi:hypothetical protein